MEIPPHTEVAIEYARIRLECSVRYCVYRDIGYFVGVAFAADSEWSRSKFTPQHLLDLEELMLRHTNSAGPVV
jgi:hypothetical protein